MDVGLAEQGGTQQVERRAVLPALGPLPGRRPVELSVGGGPQRQDRSTEYDRSDSVRLTIGPIRSGFIMEFWLPVEPTASFFYGETGRSKKTPFSSL